MLMRDFSADKGWPWLNRADQAPFVTGFRPIIAENGMVSSPHALASQVGLGILRSGGNAVDAAVATSAALMVTVPMQCSPGGDAIWLIASPTMPPSVLNASGCSSHAADPQRLIDRGLTHIPSRSIWAVTVPGVIRGWADALARFGTRSLEELLQPAIQLATDGVFVSRHLRASIDIAAKILVRSRLGRTTYRPNARTPQLYDRIRQPLLAETLTELAKTRGESIYTGKLARNLLNTVRVEGGWLDADDLASHRSIWQTPLGIDVCGSNVFAPPPNSQGSILLETLGLHEVLTSGKIERSSTHLIVEALRASRADWESLDGTFAERVSSANQLLVSTSLKARANEINLERAAPRWQAPASHGWTGRIRDGDTANFVIVDQDRMTVSCTQSVFDDFGTGIAVEPDGYMLQSRGSSFSLAAGTRNELRPSTRPPHSLSPGVRYRNGSPDLIFGAMGGSGQPQSQAQLLQGLASTDVAEAIAAPRWYIDFTQTDRSVVIVENRMGATDTRELELNGHEVVLVGPWEDVMGHLQAIQIEGSGALVGAADPRSDGQAVGW